MLSVSKGFIWAFIDSVAFSWAECFELNAEGVVFIIERLEVMCVIKFKYIFRFCLGACL